jgi:Domain of unknown function (DUF4432)
MNLYGRKWTRRELEARVGRLEQVAGIRKMKLSEGREADVEQIQVRTGAGLAYYVSPMHGMDISLAEFGGIPFSWQSPNGDVHPAYYDPNGAEWGRTAAGGLLMTCGLTQVGSPCEDGGRKYGQHGRAHHTPAAQTSATGRWDGDEYEMIVSGVVEETAMFGESLRLTRNIRSRLGENKISILDTVENIGHEMTPLMILYHFNFGFPLLSETTKVSFPEREVVARDAGTPVEGFDRWESPQPNYHERVYYHEQHNTSGSRDETATVRISNPEFPLPGGMKPIDVRLTWNTRNLPRLVEWKMPGLGMHVLGIEPANCHVEGRVTERQRGSLVTLQPGATSTYELELEIAARG